MVPWLIRAAPDESTVGSSQRAQICRALRPIDERWHRLLPLLTDTHNHMAGYGVGSRRKFLKEAREERSSYDDGDDGGGSPGTLWRRFAAPDGRAGQYVVVSCEPDDWGYCDARSWPRPPSPPPDSAHAARSGVRAVYAAAATATATGSLRQAFGVHPQCAYIVGDPLDDGWALLLRRCLEDAPWALVGESGLDRNSHYRSFFDSHQVPVFLRQLRLATELRRPISVHSVKADGVLVHLLEQEVEAGRGLPPAICLHSFSGSLETLNRIVAIVEAEPSKRQRRRREGSSAGERPPAKFHDEERQCAPCRVFVGFNAWTNLFKKRAPELVNGMVSESAFADQRILVESDWNPIDFDFPGSDRRDADKILLRSVLDLADMLDWPPEKVAKKVAQNALLFLRPVLGEVLN